MAGQSKLCRSSLCTCHEYLHPWTSSCLQGTTDLIFSMSRPILRIYATLYLLALIVRTRMPNLDDLRRTLRSILQSYAFLMANGFASFLLVCVLRRLLGRFYLPTVAFLPTFIGSSLAIMIERPARRLPLAFYVANVGSETLWHMLSARGLVRALPKSELLIFASGITAILYFYRLAATKQSKTTEPTYKVLRMLLGDKKFEANSQGCAGSLLGLIKPGGCLLQALFSSLKLFGGGFVLQFGLKLLQQLRKPTAKGSLRLLQWQNFGLAGFLGGFSLIFKTTCCLLRHKFESDDHWFAVPAGLLASTSFLMFPNRTVALYVLWKALELGYEQALEQRLMPRTPYISTLLYAFCTAILFHAAVLEPRSLRTSYYKFLQKASGERLSRFNIQPFHVFGLKSHEQQLDTLRKLHIFL